MSSLRFAFVALATASSALAYGCSSAPPGMDGPTEGEEGESATRRALGDGGESALGNDGGATGPDQNVGQGCVCTSFRNPVLVPNLPPLDGDADLANVPEGLMLVGDDGKPTESLHTDWDTIIFTHGWSREGKAENFPTPAPWRAKKFNTLIYRWHRRSFEKGAIPVEASRRIPAVAAELTGLIEALKKSLGSGASKEIRLVGHSLGGMVMTYTANKLFADATTSARRLDLLDPAYLFDFTDAGVQAVPGAGSDGGTVSYSEPGLMLASMMKSGVHVVSYNSVVAKLWGQKDTWPAVNVQEMSDKWEKGDLVNRHNAIVPYYFDSLGKAPPAVEGGNGTAFSASYPTSSITGTPHRFEQTAGIDTTDIGDDRYTAR